MGCGFHRASTSKTNRQIPNWDAKYVKLLVSMPPLIRIIQLNCFYFSFIFNYLTKLFIFHIQVFCLIIFKLIISLINRMSTIKK